MHRVEGEIEEEGAGAVAGFELPKEIGLVFLDGPLRDPQEPGDLLIRKALCSQVDDFGFTLS